MATTQNSGGAGLARISSVTEPSCAHLAAASAVGVPIINGVVTYVYNLAVSPISSAAGAGPVQGFVTVRDGATALGTFGCGFASSVTAGVAGPVTMFPLGFSYAFVTGLNVLWTSGTGAASASIHYLWGV